MNALQPLRTRLVSLRDVAATAGPFVVLAVALLALAYWLLDPMPPREVTLATGQPQGAYAAFGRRYAQLLKEQGVNVRLRETAGAAENIELLRDPRSGVDIAFVQGGAVPALVRRPGDDDDEDDGLRSLGSLFYEPVWLFYRQDSASRLAPAGELAGLHQLAGWKVSIGPPGSGVPNLVASLLEANRVDPGSLTLVRDAQTPSVQALLEGRIDAVVFAAAPESLMVQMLLQTPGIRVFDVAQGEAYARRFPFLTPVLLPRGVVDLAADLPDRDVRLVAPTATLVARAHLHPALVQLFVQAAAQIHAEAGWFQKRGDFPNTRTTERPLAREAQRFYANGPPVLQRWLPFGLANLVDRMWPVLVAIVAALLPLSRVVPPLYTFRVRSRIFRWYRQLREVEEAIGKKPSPELLRALEGIEHRVEQVSVPLSYAEELYALKAHIRMVEQRLGAATAAAPAAS